MTPEGKVKREISRVLDKHKELYRFMPVPSGFGKSSLDYVICAWGNFIAIEAKAPGKKPTPRQKMIMGQITRAGGLVLVIDSPGGCRALDGLLEEMRKDDARRTAQLETQGRGRPDGRVREESISKRKGTRLRRAAASDRAPRPRRNLYAQKVGL
jgi:hypothetical protein